MTAVSPLWRWTDLPESREHQARHPSVYQSTVVYLDAILDSIKRYDMVFCARSDTLSCLHMIWHQEELVTFDVTLVHTWLT